MNQNFNSIPRNNLGQYLARLDGDKGISPGDCFSYSVTAHRKNSSSPQQDNVNVTFKEFVNDFEENEKPLLNFKDLQAEVKKKIPFIIYDCKIQKKKK
jgi:hypothetical protein